jgi:hypothetical protein
MGLVVLGIIPVNREVSLILDGLDGQGFTVIATYLRKPGITQLVQRQLTLSGLCAARLPLQRYFSALIESGSTESVPSCPWHITSMGLP